MPHTLLSILQMAHDDAVITANTRVSCAVPITLTDIGGEDQDVGPGRSDRPATSWQPSTALRRQLRERRGAPKRRLAPANVGLTCLPLTRTASGISLDYYDAARRRRGTAKAYWRPLTATPQRLAFATSGMPSR
jgi:hypothetical protein